MNNILSKYTSFLNEIDPTIKEKEVKWSEIYCEIYSIPPVLHLLTSEIAT